MSVFSLDGIADPADRKRLYKQASHLTRWSSLFKILVPSIVGLVIAGIAAMCDWGPPHPIFGLDQSLARIAIFAIIYIGFILLGQLWRLKSERKALRFVLALEHRCTSCGYPLAGLSTNACPECGGAVERT